MPKHSPRLFGFTLLELLVVISIIGILVAMGAASFSVAQKQGRDARRRADMKSVQNAMEQFYIKGNTYVGSGCLSGTTMTIAPGVTGDSSTIVTAPKTSESYTCSGLAPSAYCACADVEQPKGNSAANCLGIGTTTSGEFYCVQQLQ